MLSFTCFAPHPPILLPDVGSFKDRKQLANTLKALDQLAEKFSNAAPELVVISSPHPDWGIQVPWHFLNAKLDSQNYQFFDYQSADLVRLDFLANQPAVLPILTTLDSPLDHFEWGRRASSQIPEKTNWAWVASGDMSHRLEKNGPYGLHPDGPKFDRQFIQLLQEKNIEEILELNAQLVENAGECGLRSFCMALGALEASGRQWEPEVLSYEGPFGVGYLVADIQIK